MQIHTTRIPHPARQNGFSLVEMMLAMLIGLIIMGGILSIYTNTRDTQRSSSDQLQLVADARFAMETIAYDLRHAGMYGGTNLPTTIRCHKDDAACPAAIPAAVDDCYAQWYADILTPVFGSDEVVPAAYGCIADHLANTDVLVVHYADSNPVLTVDLSASTMYVRSNYHGGQIFIGPNIPDPDIPGTDEKNPAVLAPNQLTHNHLLYARAYYISDHTDDADDDRPSLRRVDLVPGGPAVEDQLILPGVEDLQLQYGVDTDGDNWVDQYVDAGAVADWTKVYAVKVWVLVRAEHREKGLDTTQTFILGGKDDDERGGVDGYRRLLFSSVVRLRNMQRLDEQAAPGS